MHLKLNIERSVRWSWKNKRKKNSKLTFKISTIMKLRQLKQHRGNLNGTSHTIVDHNLTLECQHPNVAFMPECRKAKSSVQ